MSDDPFQDEQWHAFVRHFREDVVGKIAGSALTISLVPGEFDVKFAVELGASIMLDKPIIAVVLPGAPVPARLRRVADLVIEADLDLEEGRRQLAEVLRKFGGIET